MAKLGEGDERWIVKEREDGANVNNWHWQEKDAFEWSRSRFADLLTLAFRSPAADGAPPADGVARLATTGVTSLSGEAYVNRRKGKIIAGYELELKMAYEGEVDGAKVTGNVHFPYVADENAFEAPEAKILAAGDSPADRKAKEVMRVEALPVMFRKIAEFERELAAGGPGGEGDAPAPGGGSSGEGKTRRDADAPAAGEGAGTSNANSNGNAAKATREDKLAPLSKKQHTIRLTERFYCRPSDVCEALLDGGRVMHFSRSRADVRPALGPFSMFDGNITGETIELEMGVKIVQRWRFRNWAEGHHSKVTITFREPEPGNCHLDLVQEDVPESDAYGNENVMDTTEIGWKAQIFDRIRQAFGYGA